MGSETLANYQLPDRLRRVLRVLAPIVLTDDVEALGITEDVLDDVELFLRSVPAPVRLGLVAGLHAFDQSARAIPSSLGRTFASLSRERAAVHYERWWNGVGALHQLARGVKMALTFAYYEHPRVKAKLEYHPDRWIRKVAKQRLERFAAEIEQEEAAVLAPRPLKGEPLPIAGASRGSA